MNFRDFANAINRFIFLLDYTNEKCQLPIIQYICNIIFVPCNLTTGTLMPFCCNVCAGLHSLCEFSESPYLDLAPLNNLPYVKNCENTLSYLNTDFNYPNLSSDFADDCLQLPGML